MTPDMTNDLTTLGVLAAIAWVTLIVVVVYTAWKETR
jgi:hypothetical protein